MGVRLIGGEFCPLVSHLVSFDALVAWTPDLDLDVRLLGAECGNVLSGDDRVLLNLARPRDVVVGHLQIAACASVKMVTVPSVWSGCKALAIAAHSAS